MAKPKIHYQHPKYTTPHNACGLGDLLSIKLTTNIEEVTCQMCLNTTTGAKGSNRQQGDRPKIKSQWYLNPDVIERVRERSKESGISQAKIVEEAITKHLSI